MTNWYLLYGGQSEDGRGVGHYKGRCATASAALNFYRKEIKPAGPYSIGRVMMFTDTTATHMTEESLKQSAKLEKAGA